MKEFIEKLIGGLEEYKYSHLIERDSGQSEHCLGQDDCEMMDCTLCVWDKSIDIINQLAEEYINCSTNTSSGWIPCSERLPEGKESHKVLVTDEDGIMAVCYFLEVTKIFKVCWDGEEFQGVVAWQPLPEPYQPKGE